MDFFTHKSDKNGHFWNTYPPHFVHVIIEGLPLLNVPLSKQVSNCSHNFYYLNSRGFNDLIKVKYVEIHVPSYFKHTILSIAGVKYILSLPIQCNVTLLLSILHVKSSLQVLKNGSCSKIFAVFYEHPFYGVHTMYFSHSLNYFARKFFNVIKELAGFNNVRHVVS